MRFRVDRRGRSGQERERAYCLNRVRRYFGKMEGVRRRLRRRRLRTVEPHRGRKEMMGGVQLGTGKNGGRKLVDGEHSRFDLDCDGPPSLVEVYFRF